MLDIDTVLGWRGKTVRDRDGEKVGTLGALYLDDADRPAYAGVQTGMFRRNESIVPLRGAREVGGEIQIPFALERVRAAPNVDPDVALSDEEQDRLHDHYGPTGGDAPPDAVAAGGEAPPADGAPRESGAGEPAAEVTRSEEQVDFHASEPKPRERVRLKKYTVTEHVEKTVPVRREEIRVEHDPPPEGRVVDVQDVEG